MKPPFHRCLRILMCSFAISLAIPAAFGQSKPNIVVFEPDDLDPTTMQTALALGLMPNLQKYIISQGTTFNNYYVADARGCPTRESYFTGLSFHNLVPQNGNHQCSAYQINGHANIGQWLQSAGYTTSFMGKYSDGYGYEDLNGDGKVNQADAVVIPAGWNNWQVFAFFQPVQNGLVPPNGQVLPQDNPNEYNYFMSENGLLTYFGSDPSQYQADVLSAKAVSYVMGLPSTNTNPLFLLVAPGAPHVETSYIPHPLPGYEQVWAYDVRPPARYVGTVTEPLPMTPSFNDPNVTNKPQYISSKALLNSTDILELTTQWDDRLAALHAVDDLIGNVAGALNSKGMLSNTTFIFLSDNGWDYGNWRLGAKLMPYDPSISTPLYVSTGGGVSTNAMIIDKDIAATIVDMAGAQAPYALDGTSLTPLLSMPTLPWRNRYLLEYWQALALGGDSYLDVPTYKGIRTSLSNAATPNQLYVSYTATKEIEFYDYSIDPFALTNLNNDASKLRTQQRKQHVAEIQQLTVCAGAACHTAEFQ